MRHSRSDVRSRLLSVVIPVRNEEENVAALAREIRQVLAGRLPFEVIFVDDGSTDGTVAELQNLQRSAVPEIRVLHQSRSSGQSFALCNGVSAARGAWIVTLDGDGQNDPADIPLLLQAQSQAAEGVKLVMGHRKTRRDSWVRRLSSRVAYSVRNRVLHDQAPDTGCGIKLFHRETFLGLPAFDHMHRFLPALFQNAGAAVAWVDVHHRPRLHGRSKYGIGNRLWVSIVDLFGVRWLLKRAQVRVEARELSPAPQAAPRAAPLSLQRPAKAAQRRVG